MLAADRLLNTQVVQRVTLIFLNPRREAAKFPGWDHPLHPQATHTQGTKQGSEVGSRDPRPGGRAFLCQQWTARPQQRRPDLMEQQVNAASVLTSSCLQKRKDFTWTGMEQTGLWGWPWISQPLPASGSACFSCRFPGPTPELLNQIGRGA